MGVIRALMESCPCFAQHSGCLEMATEEVLASWSTLSLRCLIRVQIQSASLQDLGLVSSEPELHLEPKFHFNPNPDLKVNAFSANQFCWLPTAVKGH